MIQVRFLDDTSIEVFSTDGERFIWKTFIPIDKKKQQYFASRMEYYYQTYFLEERKMALAYWVWLRMNYDERLGIYGDKGDKKDEKNVIDQERERIGAKIKKLRIEKKIEAKKLAQSAGIDAANLSRIEKGSYSVGLDVLTKIVFALGAKIEIVEGGKKMKL